jgi:hypothetical protein
MNRTPVISRIIASIGYESGTLEIAFKRGGVYRYSGVPEHVYRDLLSAPSKGAYFGKYIRNRYPTIQLA